MSALIDLGSRTRLAPRLGGHALVGLRTRLVLQLEGRTGFFFITGASHSALETSNLNVISSSIGADVEAFFRLLRNFATGASYSALEASDAIVISSGVSGDLFVFSAAATRMAAVMAELILLGLSTA